jgi:hypothetical protein
MKRPEDNLSKIRIHISNRISYFQDQLNYNDMLLGPLARVNEFKMVLEELKDLQQHVNSIQEKDYV